MPPPTGTIDIIKEYEPKFEGRMLWISEPDKGIYDAMNKGIKMAKGGYVNFMNADDFFYENALNDVKQFISSEPLEAVYYGIARRVSIDGKEILLKRNHHSLLTQGHMPCHQSIFTASSLFCKYGLFNCFL